MTVEAVYFQCARRSNAQVCGKGCLQRAYRDVPTPGTMLSALTGAAIDADTYDRELPARQRDTLY